MGRLLICQYCREKSEKSLMKKGVHSRGYLHIDCIPAWEEEERQKKIDNAEWSDLYEYVRSLHGVVTVPTRVTGKMHEIKKGKKVSYALMLEAYKIAADKIDWFISEVLKGDSDTKAMMATLTVAMDSGLNKAYAKRQAKQEREERKEKLLNVKIEDMGNDPFKNNKSKSDDMDISGFL